MKFSIRVGSGIGPAHLRAGPLRRRHDLARRRVEDAVIERLEADADVLTVHGRVSRRRREAARPMAAPRRPERALSLFA